MSSKIYSKSLSKQEIVNEIDVLKKENGQLIKKKIFMKLAAVSNSYLAFLVFGGFFSNAFSLEGWREYFPPVWMYLYQMQPILFVAILAFSVGAVIYVFNRHAEYEYKEFENQVSIYLLSKRL